MSNHTENNHFIKENIEQVKNNIINACKRSHRNPDEVTLIAVSKTKPLELLKKAYEAGARDFGENKVQELMDKIPQMPSDVKWHMIGHLQRNKVKYLIGKVELIHSVDTLRLAEEISKQSLKENVLTNILVEVNIGQEESKFGLSSKTDIIDLVREISRLPGIQIKGLMTVAPYTENAEENREIFKKLTQLSVDIKQQNIDNISMDILSMGMTGDYEVAVEEGANFVRVGTGIFGERDYTI